MPPIPEEQLNEDLQEAGSTQVIQNPTPISVADLQEDVMPIDFEQEAEIPVFDVSTLQLTPTEEEAQDITEELQTLAGQLEGESEFREGQREERGLPEMEQRQRQLETRLNALIRESQAIPLQLQEEARGRGITRAGLRPLQTARLRENAIQSLTTASQLEASRGNIQIAQDYVDRAVEQRFAPIKERIRTNLTNLQIIQQSPQFTIEQKNRAIRQDAIQRAQQYFIEQQEQEEKSIRELSLKAIKYGADSDIAEQIQNAKSINEAILIGAPYLQDPKAKLEMEEIRVNNALKRAQIDKTRREIQAMGQKSRKEIEAEKAALKDAQARIPVIESKIDLIDGILKSDAIDSVVGTTMFGRAAGSPAGVVGRFLIGGGLLAGQGVKDKITGERQRFIGSVEQLTNKEFLDAIIGLKSQGGTLGQVSEKEGAKLEAAATKIGTWKIEDDNGNVIGYNVSEDDFKKEIQTIRQSTMRILNQTNQDLFTDSEETTLSNLLDESVDSQILDTSQLQGLYN